MDVYTILIWREQLLKLLCIQLETSNRAIVYEHTVEISMNITHRY